MNESTILQIWTLSKILLLLSKVCNRLTIIFFSIFSISLFFPPFPRLSHITFFTFFLDFFNCSSPLLSRLSSFSFSLLLSSFLNCVFFFINVWHIPLFVFSFVVPFYTMFSFSSTRCHT